MVQGEWFMASFRTSPVPFTLEGVPPLPLSPPPLREGRKKKDAETGSFL
jgi:hypothetical protein